MYAIRSYYVDMYRDAGGETLVHRIMEEKRAGGTTILTTVHHRETPLRIEKGEVDVGPVWSTEIKHARQKNLPVDVITSYSIHYTKLYEFRVKITFEQI